jgi:hypothetical protein
LCLSVKRSLTTTLAVLPAVLLASCGTRHAGSVFPVRGKVLFRGMPAVGAQVAFHPLEKAEGVRPVPQAAVGPDGSFVLSTYTRHDGAPPGRYAVTILWPSGSFQEEDGTLSGPDQLQGRYADPQKTPLRCEVRAAANEPDPFRLQ